MGKGKRKHKPKPGRAGSAAAADGAAALNGNGIGVVRRSSSEGEDANSDADVLLSLKESRRNSEKESNDILLSLEESVDWHNQTTGFVSSYSLGPAVSCAADDLAGGTGIMTNVEQQQQQQPTALPTTSLQAAMRQQQRQQHAMTTSTNNFLYEQQQQQRRQTHATTMVANSTQQQQQQQHATTTTPLNSFLHQPIAMTRIQSLESTTSSMGDSEGGDVNCGRGNAGISAIFRPPSRSPSHSPRSRTSNASSNRSGGASKASASAGRNSVISPAERSIASDSTDATSNLRPPSLPPVSAAGSSRKVDLEKPCHLLPSASAAAAARNAISGSNDGTLGPFSPAIDMVGNVISADNDRRDTGMSPLRASPRGSPTESLHTGDNDDNQMGKNATKIGSGKDEFGDGEKKKTKIVESKRGTPKRNTKKNNLVIQPRPQIPRRSYSYNPQHAHKTHKSLSALPPPHPLSNVQSYPPAGSPGKGGISPRGGGVGRKRLDRQQSWASSDAESSAGGSEATPVTTPARPRVFSQSSEEGDGAAAKPDGLGGRVLSGGSSSLDTECDGLAPPDAPIDSLFGEELEWRESEIQAIPDTISTPLEETDLKGIDISLTQSDDENDVDDDGDDDGGDHDIDVLANMVRSSSVPLFLSPQSSAPSLSCPDSSISVETFGTTEQAFDDYRGEGFFVSDHQRQFSSDDRFFEGIHNSGLQSLSFSEVADSDLNTSTEAEIELVYNTGSYDSLDNESAGARSVVSIDEEVHSEEERRAMERRILQWRRGRIAMFSSSAMESERVEKGSSREEQAKEGNEDEDEFTDEEFDSAMEMVPLTTSPADDGFNSHDHRDSKSGCKGSHNHSRTNTMAGWFRWRSPIAVIRNYIWRWHLRPDQHYDIVFNDDLTPKKNNSPRVKDITYCDPSPSTPAKQTLFNTDGAEDDDDGDESKGLTTPKTAMHSRMKSNRYDDVDFDRNDHDCCYYRLCRCCAPADKHRLYDDHPQPSTTAWVVHSGWKKLLAISILFLALAWVFSDGRLKKHHNAIPGYTYGDGVYDPLAREHFIDNKGKIVDDGDDYNASNPLRSPDDDDDQFHSSTSLPADQYPAGNPIASGATDDWDDLQTTSREYNELVGIDTIVVLGSRHTGKEWLIDRLKELYPDMNVVGEFETLATRIDRLNGMYPNMNVVSESATDDDATIGGDDDVENDGDTADSRRGGPFPRRHDRRHRFARIVDPTSKKFLPGDYTNTIDDDGHRKRKSKSAHIIVVALFLNPYDWVELMHVDPDPEFLAAGGMEWEEFLSSEFPSVDNRTILDQRATEIHEAMIESPKMDGVKLVVPVRYEELVLPYSNYDNYIKSSETLPGIVGLVDRIQARTGLRPDESAAWSAPSKGRNPFWADPVGCSGHVCIMSINKMREDAGYIEYMNEHVDWEAEGSIGYQKRSAPKPAVDQIVILGERHSGAEWLVDRISRCFPATPVKYGFDGRPGKWFQSRPHEAIPKTLAIAVFLNPYDWVELMRQTPINAPTHKDMEWSEFVTSPWERKRSNLDLQRTDAAGTHCSFGFSFPEIVPCMTRRDPESDSFPLYELRPAASLGGHGPYRTLLELRADKIRNFLGVAEFDGVVDLVPVRYEDLSRDDDDVDESTSRSSLPFPGIAGLLEKIRDQTSLVPDADAGWISDEDGAFAAEALGAGASNLDPYYVQWMEEHVDWDVERLVGYSPWQHRSLKSGIE